MNKKLLTIAVGTALGLAPLFAAQADVKVYGRVQAEVGQFSNDGAIAVSLPRNAAGTPAQVDQTIMNDAAQGRFGIAFDEDLGGGFKALGVLEFDSDTVDGSPATDPRNMHVGLSHKAAGTLRMGRIDGPYKTTGAALDPFIATNLEARNNYGMSGNTDGYGVLNGHGGYLTNMLQYISPSLVGLQLDLAIGTDSSGGDTTCAIPTTTGAVSSLTLEGCGQGTSTRGDISTALTWKGGPAMVFLAYNKMANVAATSATAKPEPTAKKIGAQFKFGSGVTNTINVQYEMIDRDTASGSGTSSTTGFGAEAAYIFLGYHLGIGNHTASIQWGGMADDVDTAAAYLALAYTYNFSKTAKAWIGYRGTALDNDLMTSATVLGNTVDMIRDENYYGIGLRKDF